MLTDIVDLDVTDVRRTLKKCHMKGKFKTKLAKKRLSAPPSYSHVDVSFDVDIIALPPSASSSVMNDSFLARSMSSSSLSLSQSCHMDLKSSLNPPISSSWRGSSFAQSSCVHDTSLPFIRARSGSDAEISLDCAGAQAIPSRHHLSTHVHSRSYTPESTFASRSLDKSSAMPMKRRFDVVDTEPHWAFRAMTDVLKGMSPPPSMGHVPVDVPSQ